MNRFCVLLLLLAAFFPLSAAPVKIMPLGDSITQGADFRNTFRRDLYFLLKNGGYSFDLVGSLDCNWPCERPPNDDFDTDHEGHWGWTTDRILTGLESWTRATEPDIALIHLGTNDVLWWQSEVSTYDELSMVIDTLRMVNPRVVILLATLIPHDKSLTIVEPMNALIPVLAVLKNTTKSPVVLVDQYTGYDEILDNYDKLHPGSLGEALMAWRWFEALKPFLSESD